jgi:peptidoglycan hydrolase-like protein with peptidoglycan-binding domain
MDQNTKIYIQEISRLMKYDRSKTLFEQETMFTRNLDRIYSKPESAEKFNKEIYEYRHEILDALAMGTFFIPLVGPLLSLGIEVGNAALYAAEGDKEMATLSAAFALIPGGEYIRQIPAIKNVSKSTIIKIFQRANKGRALSKADKEILEAVAENSNTISRMAKLGALGKMLSAFVKLSLKQRVIVLYKMLKLFPGMGAQGTGLLNMAFQIGGILYTVPKLFQIFGLDGSEPDAEAIAALESAWGSANDEELNEALEGAFNLLPEDERDEAVNAFFGFVEEVEKSGGGKPTTKKQTSKPESQKTEGGSKSIPQNIIDGVMKKGYLIRKGIHSQESKYPGMMKAIEFIQKLVGAKVDGKFGPETEGKVKTYQKSKGLKDDGIVGKDTMSKIIEDKK